MFGVLPGPKEPKDLNSFLRPFVDELSILETTGVQGAYDADSKKLFTLHAYTVLCTGDMKAIEKAMGMAGTNSRSPCRMCKIRGILALPASIVGQTQSNRRINYYPHTYQGIDVHRLSYRRNLRKTIHDVCFANNEEVRKNSGIRGLSILLELRALHFPRSFPYDTMHLIFLNTVKNIFKIWKGIRLVDRQEKKDWVLSEDDIDDIGFTMQEAGYVRTLSQCKPRNIQDTL
jgi:hypothetical protein